MLEIKVQCECGQKFKFEVEPVNGQMPFTVNCPICGADGTSRANLLLQEKIPPTAPVMSSAPPPPPPHVAPQAARLRIGTTAAAPAAAAPAIAPGPIAPRPLNMGATASAKAQPTGKENFALGVVGALAGGLVAMVAWYLIYKATGMRLGILALGVGVLTGFGAKWLGRCHRQSMGFVTAACALLCIFGAQYLKARDFLHTDVEIVDEAYDGEMKEAKALMAEIPNGTDDEIRRYLLKEMVSEGERPDSTQITPEEIKIYREVMWQRMSEFASGKTTKEQYREQQRKMEEEVGHTFVAKIIFWVMAVGIFNIVYIIAGVGVAYKIGIGES